MLRKESFFHHSTTLSMNTADFDILTVACVDLHVDKSTLKLIENNTWQARNGISIQVFNSISNSALEEKFHISQHPSVIIFVYYYFKHLTTKKSTLFTFHTLHSRC